MTKPSAKDPIIRVAGEALRRGRKTRNSAIRARMTTTTTMQGIRISGWKSPIISVAWVAAEGTISA